VDRLNVELAKALADPAVAGRLQSLGATPQASSPEKLAELIGTTSRKMAKVIEDARISAE
jgi:tripartite-type tricarboxylate transporter receptor subunit TctC